jgi:hypothetical protein
MGAHWLSITSPGQKKGRQAMSEDKTAETGGSRSFEERVFARFDAMDERLDRVDQRIETLESRQYDTKPIWEQALAAIAETNSAMGEGFDKLRLEIGEGLGKLRAEMNDGFDKFRGEMDVALRGVGRKIDVLNQNILELRADQRYFESRLEKLEPQ